MLPDLDGIDLCRALRQENQQMPALQLTAAQAAWFCPNYGQTILIAYEEDR